MTHTSEPITLEPRLVVSDADAALAFYQDALGAERLERFTDQSGRVVHAAMRIGRSVFTMTQEVAAWGLSSPDASSGSGVLLHLTVPDPDATADKMIARGGRTVIAIEDRPYGKREGRVLDPFGHAWILSKTIEHLSDDEIGKRLKT